MPNSYLRHGGEAIRREFRESSRRARVGVLSALESAEGYRTISDIRSRIHDGDLSLVKDGFVVLERIDLSEGLSTYEHFGVPRNEYPARFVECDFSGAKFHRCYFGRCEFVRCVMTGATFATSDFYRASFVDCSLVGAEFKASALARSSFAGSDLSWAQFIGSSMPSFPGEPSPLDNALSVELATFSERDFSGHVFRPVASFAFQEERQAEQRAQRKARLDAEGKK